MTKLTTLAGVKKGDRLLEVETIQGLNGQFGGAFVYPLTVVKITKVKVHVNNDYFNCGYAFRRDSDFANEEFYYGKKTELFMPDELDVLPQERLALNT